MEHKRFYNAITSLVLMVFAATARVKGLGGKTYRSYGRLRSRMPIPCSMRRTRA